MPRPAPVGARLLGPVEADLRGHPVDLGSPKQRGLFALLALEAGRVVSTERLVAELWGDAASDTAVSTLQVYVSRLRRVLETDGADPVVVRRAPGYLLDLPGDAVDTQVLERLLTSASERAARDPRAALALVDEALGLVRGPALADVADRLGDTARTEATRLDERVLTARELRLDLLLACGETAAAATEAAALAAEQPLRERVHGTLMLALYRAGRQAEALACYDRLRERLADELGVDPAPDLRHLHGQLLRHDPALAGPAEPTAVQQPARTSLVGREAELADLLESAAAARRGHGAVVGLVGEAGIGKTRLVRELADRCAADGMLVAWGTTPEDATAGALEPWHDALATLPDSPARRALRSRDIGTGADLDAGAAERRRTVRAWVDELLTTADAQPLLVVLEDVTWADAATLAVLSALAPECGDRPLMVVVTRRPEAEPEWTEIAAKLARLPHARRVDLAPLPDADAAELVRSLLTRDRAEETCAAVAERADGNPLFLVELARLLDQAPEDTDVPPEVPASVRDLLLARLQTLSPEARAVVDVAAVAGREAPLAVVAAVTAQDPDAFDDALLETAAAGVLVEDGGSRPVLRFPHALVRDVAYAELRPRARSRWHGEIARALVAAGVHDPERLAGHLLEAVDNVGAEVAVPVLLEAADRTITDRASRQADAWLAQARELAAQLPPGEAADVARLAVLRREATRAAVLHGWAAAEVGPYVADIVELCRRRAPDQETVDLLFRRVAILLALADLDRIDAEIEPLLRSEPGAGHEGEVLARVSLGLVVSGRDRPEVAHRHLTGALDLLGSGLAQGPSWADITTIAAGSLAHSLLHLRQPERSLVTAEDTIARAARLPVAEGLSATISVALLAAARGDHEAAARYAEDARVRGLERGLDLVVVLAETVLGWADVRRTRIPIDPAGRQESLVALRAATHRWSAVGIVVLDVVVATLAAEAELECGYPTEALARVAAVRPGAPDYSWRARLDDVAARATLAAGGPVRILQEP
ncbi:BTAD domain-containing putative transcriptional regulator [Nocardioides sp. SR21]|uniref:BTAD domain-containing putative transcriptional regulator n=1 Tax=Nocardioides sp. SR21 TaxID=2919501 RepID=UPI001FA9BE3A|nr:BTAD domain-containing putative transcriptional regulator [Nocardioides sp. SR21]